MNKNMISALIFTGLMLPTNALAEGITTSLGFGVGPTYGAGITFRGEKGNWGLQATALPYYTQDSSLFAGGATGFYSINKGKYGSLYTSLGVGAYRRSTKTYNSVFIETPDKCSDPMIDGKCGYWKPDVEGTKVITGGFAVGPGIGMEFDFAENFTFSIELPMAFIFDYDNKINLKSIVPVPNTALLYKF
jgi:hypothetical protein